MADRSPSQLLASNPASAFDGTEAFHISQGSPYAKKGATSDQMKDFAERLIINPETASYVASLSDAGGVVEMNVAGANDFEIPPNGTIPFPIGTQIIVTQVGAGQTTVLAGAGVTIRCAATTVKLRAQYSVAAIYKRATDEWVLSGDLEM